MDFSNDILDELLSKVDAFNNKAFLLADDVRRRNALNFYAREMIAAKEMKVTLYDLVTATITHFKLMKQ